MSISPLLLKLTENQPFEDIFGYVVFPEQIQYPRLHLTSSRPPICKQQCGIRHKQNKYSKSTDLKTNIKKDGFQVLIDTKDFSPNEISVKIVDDTIVVEGKHEEKEDEHGHISRHFIRKYTLPKEVDANEVISTLSVDGQLIIKAPPKALKFVERTIQVQQTGEAHRSVQTKESEKVTNKENTVK